jgi:hypothetical protein
MGKGSRRIRGIHRRGRRDRRGVFDRRWTQIGKNIEHMNLALATESATRKAGEPRKTLNTKGA